MMDRSPAGSDYSPQEKPVYQETDQTVEQTAVQSLWVRVLDALIHLLIRIRDKITSQA